MPIYEYYCPQNHTVYQFYAKTLAQGKRVPRCPDNPAYRLVKIVSPFAVTRGLRAETPAADAAVPGADPGDASLDAAMAEMEGEMASVDENDPRAMGRMMRRMAELTGEKIDGEMEEVVRKLEEGADPDSLEDKMGGAFGDEEGASPYGEGSDENEKPTSEKERKHRFKARRPLRRDPRLYDYDS
jgi:hypothetical protein